MAQTSYCSRVNFLVDSIDIIMIMNFQSTSIKGCAILCFAPFFVICSRCFTTHLARPTQQFVRPEPLVVARVCCVDQILGLVGPQQALQAGEVAVVLTL